MWLDGYIALPFVSCFPVLYSATSPFLSHSSTLTTVHQKAWVFYLKKNSPKNDRKILPLIVVAFSSMLMPMFRARDKKLWRESTTVNAIRKITRWSLTHIGYTLYGTTLMIFSPKNETLNGHSRLLMSLKTIFFLDPTRLGPDLPFWGVLCYACSSAQDLNKVPLIVGAIAGFRQIHQLDRRNRYIRVLR